MSISTQREIKHIPLSSLVLSTSNMRQGKSIKPEFVESLFVNGVVQPLLVSKQDDLYEVAAGRRRFYGLTKLVSDNRIDANYPVPCLVSANSEELRSISLIENLHRSNPKNTEFYTAIKQLAKEGMEKPLICQKLQINSLKYEQIMRLSNLHSKIYKAYANGDLTDEQAKAFGATNNKKRQIEVWAEADYSLHIRPQMIRAHLVSNINSKSPIALFVGMEAYKQAKGKVTEDLFGDVQSIHDIDLIRKLALEKLDSLAEQYRTDHPEWSWIVARMPDSPVDDLDIGNRLSPKFRKQTDEQKAEHTRLTAELEKFNGIDYQDMTPEQDTAYELIEAQIETLRRRVQNENQYFLKREMKYSGVYITIDNAGRLDYRMGLQTKSDLAETKKAEAKRQEQQTGNNANASDNDSDSSCSDALDNSYSQALKSDVTLYRRSMYKAELLKHTDLALELLNYSIVVSALSNNYYVSSFHDISIRQTDDETSRQDYESSIMASILEARYKKLTLDWMDHDSESDKIDAYISLTAGQKKALLSYVSAISLNSDLDNFIETETAINFRDYFTPDNENYFSRVPKSMLLEQMPEITGEQPSADDQKGTRKSLAQKLSDMFTVGKSTNKTWLPPLFRSETSD